MAYKIHTSEKTGAKVYRDAPNNEYYVVAEGENKSHESTYYTNDKADAIATAEVFGVNGKPDKTVQEILNVVIESGHYQDTEDSDDYELRRKASYYMCDAVGMAYDNGLISKKEVSLVCNAIKSYILNRFGLRVLLESNGLPHTFSNRLAIYKNWDNRPNLQDIW